MEEGFVDVVPPLTSNGPRASLRTLLLTAILVDAGYLLRKDGIGPIPFRRRPIAPAVETTLGNLQGPAHRAHPMVGLLRLDERVDHPRARRFSSLAKKAAAFLGSPALRGGLSLPEAGDAVLLSLRC